MIDFDEIFWKISQSSTLGSLLNQDIKRMSYFIMFCALTQSLIIFLKVEDMDNR